MSRATRSGQSTGPPPPGSDKLFVRQFEQMPSSDWWICLDLFREAQAGEGDLSTEEYGVILAASLADRGLQMGHSVGLAACGQETVWIPPRHSSGQLIDILRALAMVKPGERRVEELLDHVRPSMRTGASMILITPDLRPEWIGALLQLVRIGVTPTVLLLDPASFGGQKQMPGAWRTGSRSTASPTRSSPPTCSTDRRRRATRPSGSGGSPDQGKAVPVRRPIQVEWRRMR